MEIKVGDRFVGKAFGGRHEVISIGERGIALRDIDRHNVSSYTTADAVLDVFSPAVPVLAPSREAKEHLRELAGRISAGLLDWQAAQVALSAPPAPRTITNASTLVIDGPPIASKNLSAKYPTISRRHDFSNPYLRAFKERRFTQCVQCGIDECDAQFLGEKVCTPRPGWRAEHENRIALITDETARFRVRVDAQPTPEPWEPSVDDHDLLPDSWR